MICYLPYSEYLDVLIQKRISPNQGLFLHFLLAGDIANMIRYAEENQPFAFAELEELEDRGYIVYQGPRNRKQFYSDYFVVTSEFTDGLPLLDQDAGQEFWNQYPGFFNLFLKDEVRRVPAKTCDQDQLIKDYLVKIRYNKTTHAHVLEILQWAKDTGKITMGIRKWVDSRQWDTLFEERAESLPDLVERYGESELT